MNQIFLSLTGMLLVIALAYGLQVWWEASKAAIPMSFLDGRSVFMWNAILIHLILAAALLGFHGYINFKASPNRLVAAMILLAGGILTVYTPLLHLAFPRFPQFAERVNPPLFFELYPGSILSLASAFIAITGVWGLFRKGKPSTSI
jgi:hypothetical protein